jgi:hypothetical protein
MGLEEIKQAIDLVKKSSRADFEGEKTEEIIGRAEEFLGLKFPPSYRQFLRELGCGDIAGKEFYGIIDENFEKSSIPNAIWLTYDERKHSALPKELVLIGQSIEGYYALDISNTDDEGECPVVDWVAPEVDPTTVAPDFGTFFLDEIRQLV